MRQAVKTRMYVGTPGLLIISQHFKQITSNFRGDCLLILRNSTMAMESWIQSKRRKANGTKTAPWNYPIQSNNSSYLFHFSKNLFSLMYLLNTKLFTIIFRTPGASLFAGHFKKESIS